MTPKKRKYRNSALLANPTRLRQISERIPAGRWGDPADFAGVVVFLASRASLYVCGELVVVDGVSGFKIFSFRFLLSRFISTLVFLFLFSFRLCISFLFGVWISAFASRTLVPFMFRFILPFGFGDDILRFFFLFPGARGVLGVLSLSWFPQTSLVVSLRCAALLKGMMIHN